MATWDYDNFDLLVESEDDGRFRARVVGSPTGEGPTALFTLPFEATHLENLLLKLDPGRSGTRRVAVDPQAGAALELGNGLFEAVFAEDILLTWSRSQDVARAAGRGLRLRLRLTEAPAIAGLPWELLHDRRRNSYVAQSERTPVVRYLEVPQTPRPLAVDGALRVLVVVSSPSDLPELDVEAEWRRVQDALADRVAQGTVQLDRLPQPTLNALSSWLRHHDVHVLHVIGHGEFDRQQQDGVVYFCDRYSRRLAVSPSVLGPYLRDHDPLRLVLLNACQSARVDSTDPFSGLAQGLVQQDCVAVVAMQFPISDDAAAEFTGEFYGSVADGLPVDQAVTSGRKALLAAYPAEWATPVLFLRAPDGRVFDNILPTPTSGPASGPTSGATSVPAGHTSADPRPVPAEPPPPAAVAAPAAAATGPARGRLLLALLVAVLLVGGVGWWLSRGSSADRGVAQRAAAQTAGAAVSPSSATSTEAAAPQARSVTVPGTQAWTDTGIACAPGRSVAITAGGTVFHDPTSGVGPDGAADPDLRRFNLPGLGSANHSALVASLDQHAPYAVVGASSTYACPGTGTLFLGVNDGGLDNNHGSFTARLTPTG